MKFPFILLLTFSVSLVFGQTNRTEKKIIRSVENQTDDAVELLKNAVDINSGTMNFEGVKEVGKLFIKEFISLGLETEWVPGDEWGRAGHVIAKNKGGKGPTLLLIGHLDTVFEPESPFQTRSMVNDSIMKAPGISDMKGGNVIMVLALQALKEAGVLKKINLEIVLTGDEEKSGAPLEASKRSLIEAAKRSDIALAFENADGKPETIVVNRRGSSGWELKVSGNAAHSSQIFTEKVGAGAIYEAARILDAFYSELSREKDLTFNPGFIIGGTKVEPGNKGEGGSAFGKTNVVAQDVIVRGDLRAISTEQLERAHATMMYIVNNNYPGTKASISFGDGGYPPLSPSPGNYELLEMYSQVSQDLGYGKITPVNPRNAGAADVSFTEGLVEMAIDGLGMSGADDHTINETGNLNMLPVQAKRAAVLMYRLSR